MSWSEYSFKAGGMAAIYTLGAPVEPCLLCRTSESIATVDGSKSMSWRAPVFLDSTVTLGHTLSLAFCDG